MHTWSSGEVVQVGPAGHYVCQVRVYFGTVHASFPNAGFDTFDVRPMP